MLLHLYMTTEVSKALCPFMLKSTWAQLGVIPSSLLEGQ